MAATWSAVRWGCDGGIQPAMPQNEIAYRTRKAGPQYTHASWILVRMGRRLTFVRVVRKRCSLDRHHRVGAIAGAALGVGHVDLAEHQRPAGVGDARGE